MIIAIDGPTASGKGTIARRLAGIYGLPYLDTGALYRAVALCRLDAGGALEDEAAAEQAAVSLDAAKIDSDRIRSAAVGAGASVVAAMPKVRAALFTLQRDFARQPGGAVLDGRDIGTVICPEAKVKLYITASEEARTQRRMDELNAAGGAFSFDDVLQMVRARDQRDSNRAAAPLKAASDAHLLDTTALSIEAAVETARAIVEQAIASARDAF
jgi:cytidylate kinase